MNGTLVNNGLDWMPGAKELLGELKSKGISVIVWTNNVKPATDRIVSLLDGYSDLVQTTVTEEASKALLNDLAGSMISSGDPSKIELARKMKTMYMPKIPAAVGSNILVDDELVLREIAERLGAIVIDPTPTDEDISPDQWADRVAVAILANFQD